MPNPHAAPPSQQSHNQWRLKASHVFVLALVVFGVGTFFVKARMQREPQYLLRQSEQAQMDADKEKQFPWRSVAGVLDNVLDVQLIMAEMRAIG